MTSDYLDLLFTPTHEWARPGLERVRVGITDYAQREMGDFLFAELPQPGSQINRAEGAGTLESVGAVSDYYAPVTCVVTRINDDLSDKPELLNVDPYGDGWLFEAAVVDSTEFTTLVNFIGYKATVLQELEHIIYLDEANVLHYLPAVRGDDGRIIVGGKEFESSIAASLVSARAYAGREIIEEFEYLINKAGLREQELQEFFERHPDFLLGAEYASLHPQVVLKGAPDEALIPTSS
jgi:glycine cleavage system H protein